MKKVLTIALSAALMLSLSTTAFAADFVPSIEQKGSPTVEEAYVTAADDTQTELSLEASMTASSVLGYSWGTDVSELTEDEQEEYAEILEALETAYDQLKSADSIQRAISGLDEDTSYVVKDLFDLTFWGDTYTDVENTLAEDGTVTITFACDAIAGVDYYVAVLVDGTWTLLDSDCVVNNGDGTVTVTLSELGTIAFIVEADDEPTVGVVNTSANSTGSSTASTSSSSDTVTSPQTSDNTTALFASIAALCAALGVSCFVIAARRRKA